MHYALFYVETFSTLTWLRFSTFKPLKFHIIYPNLSYPIPILTYPILSYPILSISMCDRVCLYIRLL